MVEKNKIFLIISLIMIIILAGNLIYVYKIKIDEINSKNTEINQLNQNINNLNFQINSLNNDLILLKEDFNLVKFCCLFNIDCKEDYNEKLRDKFLERNGLRATYKYVGSGLNYYKYFLSPTEVEDLPANLKEFIKQNCPSKIYDTPGLLFSRYTYQLEENKVVEILMDDKTVEILCAWIKDESTGSFSKIQYYEG